MNSPFTSKQYVTSFLKVYLPIHLYHEIHVDNRIPHKQGQRQKNQNQNSLKHEEVKEQEPELIRRHFLMDALEV